MTDARFSLRCSLALVALLALATTGLAGEDEVVDAAVRGTVSGLLHDFRGGDPAARAAAKEGLLARARFTLPYVLAAAESTDDGAWRKRCRALADALRAEAGGGVAFPNDVHAEFPAWEETAARNFVLRTQRAAVPDGPRADLASARRLREAERHLDAARTILAFVDAHPNDLVEALEAANGPWFHRDAACAEALAPLEARARAAMKTLPAPEKARVALALAGWYRDGRKERLEEIAHDFADDPAGLVARVRLIHSYVNPASKRVGELEALAQAHPGAEAARLALQDVAFQYATINLLQDIPDPLVRFRKLAAVAMRLQSDEFPGSDGRAAAVARLNDFYLSARVFSSRDAATALLAAYRTFYRHHFLLDALTADGAPVAYYLPGKLTHLHRALGVADAEIEATVDRELAELEADLPDRAAIRYLRAERRARAGDLLPAAKSMAAIEAAFPETLYARKALAARAGLQQARGKWKAAETLYARYAKAFPESPFAWLAALRIGHCRFLRGEWIAAIHAYEEAGASFPPEHVMLSVLVPVSLARCYEASGQIVEAAHAYGRALGVWPQGEDPGYATQLRSLTMEAVDGVDPDASVTRSRIQERRDRLSRPGADPEDVRRLVYGEKLRERGSVDRALKVWAALAAERPDAPVAADAREAIAAVWIQRAIEAADRSRGRPNEAKALEAVAAAEAADARFGHFLVAFVRSALLLRHEMEATAQKTLGGAVERWATTQEYRAPHDDLERRAAAVRAAAFMPGHPDYNVDAEDRQGSRPHVVVCSTIEVVDADGSTQVLDLAPEVPDLPQVLYFTRGQLRTIERGIDRLGALKDAKDGPGDRGELVALLRRSFPVRHGHWHGWHLATYPWIGPVRFHDADRTQATAGYRVRYTGGEVTLRRRGDAWTVTDIDFQWME